MNPGPRVAIVLINWHGIDDTAECLASLARVRHAPLDVIVVDNGSSLDEVAALRARFAGRASVLPVGYNAGFAEGCNVGIRFALRRGAEHVLLLNNDTVVAPDLIDRLLAAANSDPAVGAVGAAIHSYHRREALESTGGTLHLWLGDIEFHTDMPPGHDADGAPFERDFVLGTALLASAAALTAVGELDPFFFFNFEDVDWCLRARERGYKVLFAPAAKVFHKVGASRGRLDDFPGARAQHRARRGFNSWRYYRHLYRKQLTAPLWLVPFVLRTTELGTLARLVGQGRWHELAGYLGQLAGRGRDYVRGR
jgi:GT2 family glycosyltransferase